MKGLMRLQTNEACSSPPLLPRPSAPAQHTWLPSHVLRQSSSPPLQSEQSAAACQPAATYQSATSGNQQCIRASGPRPAGYVNTSSESSADTSSDDGIELQEQGHVEALENTIGELTALS